MLTDIDPQTNNSYVLKFCCFTTTDLLLIFHKSVIKIYEVTLPDLLNYSNRSVDNLLLPIVSSSNAKC